MKTGQKLICEHSPLNIATCGKCHKAWCDDCDPAPSALCHYCHGRGYSYAPRKDIGAFAYRPIGGGAS